MGHVCGELGCVKRGEPLREGWVSIAIGERREEGRVGSGIEVYITYQIEVAQGGWTPSILLLLARYSFSAANTITALVPESLPTRIK